MDSMADTASSFDLSASNSNDGKDATAGSSGNGKSSYISYFQSVVLSKVLASVAVRSYFGDSKRKADTNDIFFHVNNYKKSADSNRCSGSNTDSYSGASDCGKRYGLRLI